MILPLGIKYSMLYLISDVNYSSAVFVLYMQMM